MKQSICVLLLMGIMYKPTLHMNWSSNKLLSTPIFREIMNHNRLYLLLKKIIFNDNRDPEYDQNDENHEAP